MNRESKFWKTCLCSQALRDCHGCLAPLKEITGRKLQEAVTSIPTWPELYNSSCQRPGWLHLSNMKETSFCNFHSCVWILSSRMKTWWEQWKHQISNQFIHSGLSNELLLCIKTPLPQMYNWKHTSNSFTMKSMLLSSLWKYSMSFSNLLFSPHTWKTVNEKWLEQSRISVKIH